MIFIIFKIQKKTSNNFTYTVVALVTNRKKLDRQVTTARTRQQIYLICAREIHIQSI